MQEAKARNPDIKLYVRALHPLCYNFLPGAIVVAVSCIHTFVSCFLLELDDAVGNRQRAQFGRDGVSSSILELAEPRSSGRWHR